MESKVAIVTGSNKGIGFEIVKGLCQRYDGAVYLTARDTDRGRQAVKKLEEFGFKPLFHLLDVTKEDSVREFANHIRKHHIGIDILMNNAGLFDFNEPVPPFEYSKNLIDTNFMSLLTIAKHLYPLLHDDARVINLTSDWGMLLHIRKQIWLDTLMKPDLTVDEILQFVDDFLQTAQKGKTEYVSFAGEYGDYKVSKVAMSALTCVHQRHFQEQGKDVSVNCVNPGFVKTDMTNHTGHFTVERGARAPLFLALDAPQSLKGVFIWHDCRQVKFDDPIVDDNGDEIL